MSLVTERCRKCKWHGYVCYGELCCDYMYLTDTERGCPAGDECTKFAVSSMSPREMQIDRAKERIWG